MAIDLTALAASIGRPVAPALDADPDLAEPVAPTRPPGSRGRLDDLAEWLAAVHGSRPPRRLERVRLVVLAGDVDDDVSTLADQLDVGVRAFATTGPDTSDDELTRPETEAAVEAGVTLANEEVDSGADLLVVADVAPDVAVRASALVGLLTRSDASLVTSKGVTIDDALWMRNCAAVRDTMRRGRPLMADHVGLLAAVGGADLATMTGLLLQAAARRTPVLLDGIATAAAALVAQRLAFRSSDWWAASHRSPEPAHELALDRLGVQPLLDLGVRAEDGTGALLAVPLLRAAAVQR
jgi:nicotinate-nucleotide--dimethylbenzimidazole phosphoribosyltransferase